MSVSIGFDPEILLIDDNDEFLSVEGLVGGTKSKPVPIPEMKKSYFEQGFAMQEDNVMLEFNTAPANDWRHACNNVDLALHYVGMHIGDVSDARFYRGCVGTYSDAQLSTGQAREFGCSPDLDAYTRNFTTPISPAMLGNERYAGGHIHIGYGNTDIVPHSVVAQLADALVGLWEVYYKLSQGNRRQHYGTAGRYRVKPYGIEYRTPSNQWLWDDTCRSRMLQGADNLATILDQGNTPFLHKLFTEIPRQEVAIAINQENTGLAIELSRFISALLVEDGYE